MPLGGISTLFGDILSLRSLILGFLILSTGVSIRRWANGRKNTWERDWAGKMVLVVGQPTPIILHLIHHLLHLAHPPEILYLPPLASPLPQPLLTILHTIRLSASSPLHATSSSSTGPPDPSAPSLTPAPTEHIRPAELTCEPLPRSPSAIRDFIRKWTMPVPGVGQEGRRVDVVVWGDGWEVEKGFEVFEGEMRRVEKEDLKAKAAAETERRAGSRPSGRGRIEAEDKTDWTMEEARFHLMTAILPSLLKAPMERSIRFITLVSPFYAAGIPFMTSSTSADADPPAPKKGSATAPHEGVTSPIAHSGIQALRTIALWKHLQKVLNALATMSTGSKAPEGGVEVPPDAEDLAREKSPASEELNFSDGQDDASGLRQRKARAEFEEHLRKSKPKEKNIGVQSNILALTVAVGLDRSILRTLVGVRAEGAYSAVGWYLYLFFLPVIWMCTPSPQSSINSILHAMSAPVAYPELENTATSGDLDEKKPEDKPGVPGGAIVRDCEVVSIAAPVSVVERHGQRVWDELEKQVEAGVKACIAREKLAAEKQAREGSTQQAKKSDESLAADEELDEDEEWEKLNAGEGEALEKDSVY